MVLINIEKHICRMALGLAFLFVSTCGNNEKISTAASSHPGCDWILVFLDKTLSVNDEAILNKHKEAASDLLTNLLDTTGDRIAVHYIHGNSAGVTAAISHHFQGLYPDEKTLAKLGKISQNKKIKVFRDTIQLQRDDIQTRFSQAFSVSNTEQTNLQTDIWASLETISRFFSENTLNEGDRKWVLFISDMEESVKGSDRRDFTKSAPNNKEEAIAWADEDIKIIRQLYEIKPEAFQHIRLKVYLTRDNLKENNFQHVRYYWEALFNSLGIASFEVI